MTGVGANRVHVIPLGVDVERIRPATPEDKTTAKASLGLEGKSVVLFAGALYGPNIQAVKSLFGVAEQLNRSDVVFVVVGRVGELFQSTERVFVTGQVDDVLPYFTAADIGVNPMLSGGGMQVKLLEFLAAGLPTVTTPVGARGLAAESGRDLVVAEIAEFAPAIESLLKNESGGRSMAAAGRILVESRYSWSAIGQRRVALYDQLVAATGRRS
jgi:glycosyltransferase involved in cell wall biosynthesis